ncbi:MAG: hypothetical protein A2600_13820 [Candidatus Lambdaproteobacteria bacterium RIFOXYD1_FULL_56_27]|uniref:Calcineurin-like phosphoesterase domain-containing protein n=1 Tax=Candidatus Lambdaproteobacteria bacterium RIFOXYD2_FULL_56_26 TaxID=1817773 RepID=A0A1F6GRQ1_9PROT|nr:MAG: hypothetical protein A2426_11165 [Candidatus Lambdaproteobacteria bacterium RIFOXYC1_FULL_56_13]OGH00867.1 MAG: hypothetical protein A2557_01910 [Candidatus Lambdaproteobacteria bacterium RIFOXYD2_FULL_56_26]OGH08694.1 MAG: hypothetical protein A2600_13820 [Candidatus Lambdaproteobacteria bacterium RIFOXYD1_FULL_56_27]
MDRSFGTQTWLAPALEVLSNEDPWIRPLDRGGHPGGLVLLKEDLPTFILPDLHGRHEFLKDCLSYRHGGRTLLEGLEAKAVQLVCLGDGMHSELRGRERWQRGLAEYEQGFEDSPAMDQEMEENLKTMALVLELKAKFGPMFHFFKGNHENILGLSVGGDHPFAKFAAESPMTKLWVEKNLGEDFLNLYANFEQALPILGRGRNFLLAHSRPREPYGFDQVINYKDYPDLIEGLTWTRDHQAQPGAIPAMYKGLLGGNSQESLWISGHTPVANLYRFEAVERLLLIHNPARRVVCRIEPGRAFQLETDIFALPESG